MKKELTALPLCLLMMYSCTNEDFSNLPVSPEKIINVSFATKIVGTPNINKETRKETSTDPAKIIILAYKRNENGKYTYALSSQDLKTNSVTTEQSDNIIWENPEFKLEVGSYRFIAFYNVADELNVTYPTDATAKDWTTIQNQITIKRISNNNLNVNEIFTCSLESIQKDIELASTQENNKVIVNLTLQRINARIDYRFLHFKKKEVPSTPDEEWIYDSGHNVFNNESVNITTSAKYFTTWNWEQGSDLSNSTLSYTTLENKDIQFGTRSTETDFPGLPDDHKLMDNIPTERIANGAAYYTGAYILPFATKESQTFTVNVSVSQTKHPEKVRHMIVDGVKVEPNKVTVITFKYRSDDKNDHIFNPEINYDITIDTQWNGFISIPSIDI